MKGTRLWMLGLVMASSVAACNSGSDATAPVGGPDVSGTYTLQSVNGGALPAVISTDGTSVGEVLSDTFVLNADQTWTESGTFRVTNTLSGAVQTGPGTNNGTYTQSNTTLTLTSAATGTFQAAVSGTTLAVYQGGVTSVYSKDQQTP